MLYGDTDNRVNMAMVFNRLDQRRGRTEYDRATACSHCLSVNVSVWLARVVVAMPITTSSS